MKKWEFSKWIMLGIGVITIVVTLFTMAVVWKTDDTSALAYLIPAVFAELATATGFYYSKAKMENGIKLRRRYGADVYNDARERIDG